MKNNKVISLFPEEQMTWEESITDVENEIKISLKDFSKLFDLEYYYVWQKLNQLEEVNSRIKEYVFEWNKEIYIVQDGLFYLLPFLEIDNSKKTVFAINDLMANFEAQKTNIMLDAYDRIKVNSYEKVKDFINQNIEILEKHS